MLSTSSFHWWTIPRNTYLTDHFRQLNDSIFLHPNEILSVFKEEPSMQMNNSVSHLYQRRICPFLCLVLVDHYFSILRRVSSRVDWLLKWSIGGMNISDAPMCWIWYSFRSDENSSPTPMHRMTFFISLVNRCSQWSNIPLITSLVCLFVLRWDRMSMFTPLWMKFCKA